MDDLAKSQRALSKLPGSSEPTYEVGYGKPPAQTQFKPGRSGNPLGRPRGAKKVSSRIPALNEERLKAVVLEEAYRTIDIRDGEKLIEIPVIQAVIRSVALNAAKGNQKSQRMFAELLQWVERENKALHDQWLNTAMDYKIGWDNEIAKAKKLGIEPPNPIPHPDHIVINMNTGQVEVRGPMTKEEKVKWDRLRGLRKDLEAEIALLEEELVEHPKSKGRLLELEQNKKLLRMFDERVPHLNYKGPTE